ncbi:MAG: MolR family transcriptional regulator [Desulfurococcales archaeon ex4484_204]|nr:MAG: MolR family transcriptional regulator [Desulfurococcales archaeon ex4484_204]
MRSKAFEVRVDVILEVGGKRVADCRVAKLLLLVGRYGSILAASRVLGIPYSRAWEALVRAERALGEKLVEVRRGGRGGGGARLTEAGRELLEEYLEVYRRVTGRELEVRSTGFTVPDLVYMGSHDPCVEILAGLLRGRGVGSVELSWIGSGIGLAALAVGEADVAGLHLLDPASGEYNKPYIGRYWLEGEVALVRGYYREVGFITREPLSYEEVVEGLVSGGLRLVNRQRGSGTRILLEHVLAGELGRRGLKPSAMRGVPGFENVVSTHTEVARAVASGEADVGMGIRWAAVQYGLYFTRVRWEAFDFAIPRQRLGRGAVKAFLEALKSRDFREQVGRLPGYEVPSDIGEEVL